MQAVQAVHAVQAVQEHIAVRECTKGALILKQSQLSSAGGGSAHKGSVDLEVVIVEHVAEMVVRDRMLLRNMPSRNACVSRLDGVTQLWDTGDAVVDIVASGEAGVEAATMWVV